MRTISLIATALVLTGCTTSYWDRPGATLPVLADESETCYRGAIDTESPSALPGPGASPSTMLPRTTPPPKLWERAPREAGFEHLDEQLRYERCMRVRGWRAVKTPQ